MRSSIQGNFPDRSCCCCSYSFFGSINFDNEDSFLLLLCVVVRSSSSSSFHRFLYAKDGNPSRNPFSLFLLWRSNRSSFSLPCSVQTGERLYRLLFMEAEVPKLPYDSFRMTRLPPWSLRVRSRVRVEKSTTTRPPPASPCNLYLWEERGQRSLKQSSIITTVCWFWSTQLR